MFEYGITEYAVEVEKTGSITQAAGNLYMDQPNLEQGHKDSGGRPGCAYIQADAQGRRSPRQRQNLSGICKKRAGAVRGDGSALQACEDGQCGIYPVYAQGQLYQQRIFQVCEAD